jgi:branched-chain amino acid transport system substrate-binding protein
MKTLKNILGISVILLAVASCNSCNQKRNDEIKIGAALPLTGDIASYGKSAQNGIDLAIEQINKDSNTKIKFAVDYQDTKGDKQTAVNIFQKFATIDKYSVVIGEAASSVSQAMIPIATSNKVVQISPISSSSELTGEDFFFRICPSDAFQASISAKWILTDGFKKAGILYVNNAWGKSLMELFKKNFESAGGKVVDVEASNEGDKDFKTQITKLLHSDIDVIYCPTYGKEGGVALKQLKELGNKLPIYGADVWSSPELLTTAKEAAEGVKIVKPSELASDTYNVFKEAFKRKYNSEPDVYAAYSYDIVMVLKAILNNNKRVNGEQVKEFLLNMPLYNGVTGQTKFDLNGDCNTKPFIKQIIKNGNYTNF